jgi:hypothetical protein
LWFVYFFKCRKLSLLCRVVIDSIFAPFVPALLLATLAFLVDFEPLSNDFLLVDMSELLAARIFVLIPDIQPRAKWVPTWTSVPSDSSAQIINDLGTVCLSSGVASRFKGENLTSAVINQLSLG